MRQLMRLLVPFPMLSSWCRRFLLIRSFVLLNRLRKLGSRLQRLASLGLADSLDDGRSSLLLGSRAILFALLYKHNHHVSKPRPIPSSPGTKALTTPQIRLIKRPRRLRRVIHLLIRHLLIEMHSPRTLHIQLRTRLVLRAAPLRCHGRCVGGCAATGGVAVTNGFHGGRCEIVT